MAISRRQSLKAIAAAGAMRAVPVRAAARAAAKPVRLIALDVGGTLIQDHGEVPQCMQGALAAGGIQVSFAEIADWRGASKREMVRHFVALRVKTGIDRGALTTAIYKDFVARANAAYADVQPIAGAKDAIGLLRSKGFLLATTTGFDRQLSDFIFERLAWRGLFDATVASDEVADGRPAPYMLFHAMELTRVNDVAEVIAVGDTPLDLQAAANAGVRGMIGVYSGAASEERLRKESHTHILASVAQLPALLAAEF